MKKYLKISFRTNADLINARKFLEVTKKKNNNDIDFYLNPKRANSDNPKDLITDIREYDVPYHCRVCIDTGIRAGKWFEVQLKDKFIIGLAASSKKSIPDLKVLAFDIETSKDRFKFPEKDKDIIMMISLMF